MKEQKEYKYSTEATINLYLGPHRLCQQSDFKLIENDEAIPYYEIYFICQRNRIALQIEHAKVFDTWLGLTFDVFEKNEKFTVPAVIPNPFSL